MQRVDSRYQQVTLNQSNGQQVAVTYDQNTLNTAPSGFFSAVNYVVSLFDVTFTNNVTVNIKIGYGTFPYDNSSVPALGESEQNGLVWGDYLQVRQALINEGAPGSSTLPASSPLRGNLAIECLLDRVGARGNATRRRAAANTHRLLLTRTFYRFALNSGK